MENPVDFDPAAEFGGLGFDQLRQIAAADRDHAYGIDEQARAATALNKLVEDAITHLGDGFTKVNQPALLQATDELMAAGHKSVADGQVDSGLTMVFQGKSARAAITQLIKLGERSKTGKERIATQPGTLTALAQQVRDTDTAMAGLAEERQRLLDLAASDPANPELLKLPGVAPGMSPETLALAVTMKYDTLAREKMQTSVNGYYAQASQLEAPQIYEGPRVAPPPDRLLGKSDYRSPGGEYGPGGHNSPGPELNRDRDLPGSTTSTGHTPSRVDYTGRVSEVTGPELTGPAGPGPGSVTPVTNVPGPPPSAPPVTTVFGPLTSGGHFVPNQAVTRPVYGTRPVSKLPTTTRPMLRPNTSGLVRPVIGERPGKALNAFGRPQRPVVRPLDARGLNAPRTNPLSGRGLPSRGLAADPRATGQNRATTRTPRIAGADGRVIGQTRGGRAGTRPTPRIADGRVIGQPRGEQPGVRALTPKAHTADGRVVRAKPDTKPAFTVERAEFSREPRLTHGGNDNHDNAALRNSRPLSATPTPALTPRDLPAAPAPAPAGDWSISGTVPPVIRGARDGITSAEYDPGHYVTAHNLGKRL